MKHLQLSAVVRRLPQSHMQFLYWEEQNSRAAAGHAGEQQVVRLLGELGDGYRWIPGFSYNQHEIDILLVTKHCLFCIEVKNIAGRWISSRVNRSFFAHGVTACRTASTIQSNR